VGMPLEKLMPERFRAAHHAHLEKWFSQPRQRAGHVVGLELSCLRKDGTEFPAEIDLNPIQARQETLGVAFVSDITERKRNERQLLEYRDQLAAEVSALTCLREAGDRLWRSHDIKAGLEDIIDAGIALLGADMGHIQLLNQEKQVLEIVAQRGFGPDFLEHFREVSAADTTASGRCLREKRRIIIEDVETDADFGPHRAAAAAAGYRAVHSRPLLGMNGEIIGVFSTHFRRSHRPSEQELSRFDLYAYQAAEFIERIRAEEELRRSQGTVQALLETAAQGILAIDKDGRIVLANATAEKMFGHSRAELIGQPVEFLMPERFRTRDAQHPAGWFAEPGTRPMGSGLDLAGLREDGSEFPIEVGLSHIGAGEKILSVAFVSDITQRKKNEQTLVDYQGQLQKLTAGLIEAQESGNRAVARELHDVFSQELAVAAMEISSLKEEAKSGAELADRLSDLGTKIKRLASEIHRTSRELHPAILEELGLDPALRQECEAFQQRSGIPTQFRSKNVPAKLPNEVTLCLYRIAQESLQNIGKHAPNADIVRMSLSGSQGGVTLRIEDTGEGFELDEVLKKGGLGLISMEERVRVVNGKLTIKSKTGKGTIVTAFVPLVKQK
jgi:PAS domain S-box-containing protein